MSDTQATDDVDTYTGSDIDTALMEKLLRRELAAVESYEHAAEDLTPDGGPLLDRVRGMLQYHRDAVRTLERHVRRSDGDPDQDSGAWGAFAKAVEKAGAALGDRPLLEAMKQGEVHGLSIYRTALDSGGLPAALEEEIRDRFLPAQEQHVRVLDELLIRGA